MPSNQATKTANAIMELPDAMVAELLRDEPKFVKKFEEIGAVVQANLAARKSVLAPKCEKAKGTPMMMTFAIASSPNKNTTLAQMPTA